MIDRYINRVTKSFSELFEIPAIPLDKETSTVPNLNISNDSNKVIKIKTATLNSFADTERILSKFRQGDCIMLVKMSKLREKNIKDLKKAVSRLKSHCKATSSDIRGMDENWLLLCPSTATIVSD
jgi:SepF-like predicted cell division protein (DUF552 family)